MAYADELLKVASRLAHDASEADDPIAEQAHARRSVSTAYYAAFHLLVGKAVERLVPGGVDIVVANLMRRAPTHDNLSKLCATLLSKQPSKAWKEAGFVGDVAVEVLDLARLVHGL